MTNGAYDILERLIAFPTISRRSNIELIRYIAGLLADAGITFSVHPSADGERASLFASVGPSGPGGVVLSGHTDVVPVEGQAWTSDPFRLAERSGRLYGRGAADMKGFVACTVEAMLMSASRRLAHPLHLALSYDEEIGCIGVRPMLAELASAGLRPDWVWVGEPTSMQIATGHKGKTSLYARCRGHAAHSALAPKGFNAIHLAADLLSEIRNLQSDLQCEGLRDNDYDMPFTTVHAGVIRGGTVLNIVPDSCDLEFEVRNIAEDDVNAILDRLFAAADKLTRSAKAEFDEAGIKLEVTNTYPGLATNIDSPALSAARAVLSSGKSSKVAFGTEGGLFRSALKTEVVVCGPGSMDEGHKPDEFVSRADIELCRNALARLTDVLE